MAVISSFTTGTTAADAMDTLNRMLADIKALQAPVVTPISISGTPASAGQVGVAYSFTPSTSGGNGNKTFALSGGPLLAGLAFSTSTGAITGTPTVAGSMPNIVVTVTDSSGSAATTATSVTIAAAAPVLNNLSLSNTSLQAGTASTITINGATSGTTIAGTPPEGMTLNSSARTITGTPTTAGTYVFDLTENGAGASNSPRKTSVTITVAAAPAATPFFGSSTQSFGDDSTTYFGKAA